MTYCLAASVDAGLVFASDSRTNAGVDHVSTYSKMHVFGRDGDRQIVLLSAGNLATTQAVIAQLDRDIRTGAPMNLMVMEGLADAADYVGQIIRNQEAKHGPAVAAAGFSPDATFIMGGQIGQRPPKVYLIYPQGNYITTSEQTRYLQIGETKYGKPILDRVIHADMSLEEAARCALVSIDSTMRSNATVGPPIELLAYRRDALVLSDYTKLVEDDPYLLEIRRAWNENITQAFLELPPLTWDQWLVRPRD
ncbi:MAG: peptidase [Ectothiorhodospiraceae bacterium]|nr:peptidase [Ectothiorhodospiraceae bacterium]